MQIAKRQAVVNPENTFFSVKRFIGRRMNEVKDESKQIPYEVRCLRQLTRSRTWLIRLLLTTQVVEENQSVKIRSTNANKLFAPEEISAQVLRKLTDDAAKFLNDKVRATSLTDADGATSNCLAIEERSLHSLQGSLRALPLLDLTIESL